MKTFSGQSANEVWKEAATSLLLMPQAVTGSRCGDAREILHAVLQISDPRQRWVVSRLPCINPAFALAEVIWILNGRDDTAFLENWFPSYQNYVGGSGSQYAAYGKRLRVHFGFDQLTRAYQALKCQPEGRQVVLQIWSPDDDMPLPNGSPRSGDIPCNLLSCLKLREGKLHWLQIIRSNDIEIAERRIHIVQFTMLQEIMAGWLGADLGEYMQVIDSLHWYVEQSARLSIDENIVPKENADILTHSFDESCAAFAELARRMDGIVEARRSGQHVIYESHQNLPESI